MVSKWIIAKASGVLSVSKRITVGCNISNQIKFKWGIIIFTVRCKETYHSQKSQVPTELIRHYLNSKLSSADQTQTGRFNISSRRHSPPSGSPSIPIPPCFLMNPCKFTFNVCKQNPKYDHEQILIFTILGSSFTSSSEYY